MIWYWKSNGKQWTGQSIPNDSYVEIIKFFLETLMILLKLLNYYAFYRPRNHAFR